VTSVLDTALEGRQYLVGDKCTYADLSFVTWAENGAFFAGDKIDLTKYKNFSAWLQRLKERESVKSAFADKAEAMAAQHK
jgi:glutathione S-transferase